MAKQLSTATFAGIAANTAFGEARGIYVRRCAALNKAKQRCGGVAMRGKEVCRMHGGNAGAKPRSGVGAYDVTRLAGDIAARYEDHLANPDYTSLQQELALARTYLEQYLSTHSPSSSQHPPPLTSDFFSTLLGFLSRLSRLAKSQAEIEWGPQHLITATQAMTFYQSVLEGVRRHVTQVGERERVFEYIESTLGLAGLETREALRLSASRPAQDSREAEDLGEIRVEATG